MKIYRLLLGFLLLGGISLGQTHTFPALDTNNSFTGSNTHLGLEFFKNLEGVRSADQFSGASVGSQIDNACADLAGSLGFVKIPNSMAAGDSIIGIPNNCIVVDERGGVWPNEFGQEDQNILKGAGFRARWTSSADIATYHSYTTARFYSEGRTGGVNQSAGPWGDYTGLLSVGLAKTPGQPAGARARATHYSHGDTIAVEGIARTYGGTSGTDDEGTEAVRGQAVQGSGTGTKIFTATISTAVNNGSTYTLNYSSPSNEFTRGEQRYVIDTTRAVTTGTYTGVAGTPPIVTFSGVSLLTALSVSGGTSWANGVEAYCFSSVSDDDSGNSPALKYVVPIRTVTDATHATLNLQVQLSDLAWPGTASGNYRIYPCGRVTTFADTGAVTVSQGTAQWAASDVIEMPLLSDQYLVGGRFIVEQRLPTPRGPYGLYAINNSTKSYPDASAVYVPGPWAYGLRFQGSLTNGVVFTAAPTNGMLVNNDSALIRSVIHLQAVNGDFMEYNANDHYYGFGTGGGRKALIRATDGQFNTQNQYVSTLATGAAPLVVASTTPVATLTVSNHPTTSYCGTTTTCANTAETGVRIVTGKVALTTGAATIASITAFSGTANMFCRAQDETTPTNAASCVPASTSSLTLGGTGSDTISYTVIGW